jgi:hypothetical protein
MGRFWSGFISLSAKEHLEDEGLIFPITRKNLFFRNNLCYLATCSNDWFRDDDRWEDFIRSKRLKKPVKTAAGKVAA